MGELEKEGAGREPGWVWELRKSADDCRRQLMRRVVFVVMVSWTRPRLETRRLEEEYARLRRRVPEGTALFLGRSEGVESVLREEGERFVGGSGGVKYDAVMALRGQLATMGEVKEWVGLGEDWVNWKVREPVEWLEEKRGEKKLGRLLESSLRGFLADVQDEFARGGETCGERVVVERGDVGVLEMLVRMVGRQRYESEKKPLGKRKRLV